MNCGTFGFWLSTAQTPLQGGKKVNIGFEEVIFKASACLSASIVQGDFFRVR